MYSAYINHFKRGNSVIDTEELMFAVPNASGFPVTKPIIKGSEDSADNLSFSMEPNSPYYDAILPLKTTIRVEYDGDIIFFGRALAPSTSTVFHTKSVTCVGKFAYLNDTYYEGKPEKNRSKITVNAYYNAIIANHNAMAPAKAFTRGITGITLPTETDKYEPSSWSQTSNLISSLTSSYGGHMRARYTSGDMVYLDWYKYYARDLGDGLRPKVTVGKNILDISSETSTDDLISRLIPIGANNHDGSTIYLDGYVYKDKNNQEHTFSGKAFPIPMIRDLYTDQELTDEFHDYRDYRDAETNFGIIYKTISFGDCDTQEKLFNETKKWIKEAYFGFATSFSVKAIDLHVTDGTIPKILLGECVDVSYYIMLNSTPQWMTKKLVCKSIQYDLFNPENNTYTFGVPTDLLNKDRKKSSAVKTSSGATAANRVTPKADEDAEWTWRKVWRLIGDRDVGDADYNPDYDDTDCYVSFGNNGELSGTKTCYDPNEVVDGEGTTIGNNYKNYPERWFSARIIGKITKPGKSVKWVAVSEDRGIFAYTGLGDPSAVRHWYLKKSGCYYSGKDNGLSTFEDIAQMIEQDPSEFGGTTNANSFRTYGRISGSVKAYDPEKTDSPSTHPEEVFQAEIVGKFGSAGSIKYVASSSEYGIFAYTHSAYPDRVTHWYMQVQGVTYDNVNNLITEDESGDVFATNDGTPDGDKTVWFQPTEINTINGVQVSEGKAFFGYDLRSQQDKWKIGLNVPIVYNDQQGVEQIADGFVSASDFNIESIPSFKTKLAVVDILIAGKVDAIEIEADIAYVRDLAGDVIKAGTGIRTDHFWANDIHGLSYNLHVPSSSGSGYDEAYLENCFSNCLVWAGQGGSGPNDEAGHIYFQFNKIGGGVAQVVNFNMSDTQFFKDAVADAKDLGWNSSRAIVSDSFPKSNTEQSIPNTNWVLKLPKTGFNSGSDDYNVSVSDLTDYAYSGATMKVYNIKIGNYIAYRKQVPLQNKNTITPSTSDQTITPDSGYDGISQVIVAGDSDLTAGNIKKDVSIFGVTGSYEAEPSLEDKGTITPSTSDQTITPGSGYDGISQVIVAGDSDLTAGNIKKDVSIFGVTGTMKSYSEGMSDYYSSNNWATPSSSNGWKAKVPKEDNSGSEDWFTVSSLSGSNLSASNIKKDVSIFGVTGTYQPSVTPSTDIQIGSYTNTSDEPSYGTNATLMRDTILACISNGNWFSFKVTINGVSGEKYYKLSFKK